MRRTSRAMPPVPPAAPVLAVLMALAVPVVLVVLLAGSSISCDGRGGASGGGGSGGEGSGGDGGSGAEPSGPVTVGSKKFTESVILGEIASHLLRHEGSPAEHRRELGGTRILFHALEQGEIDLYPEYTGTIRQEILHGEAVAGEAAMARALRERGIAVTAPLGFNNTYAIGMRPELADSLGIESISDLRDHADLRVGLTNEFLNRNDGWPSLKRHYRLPQHDVRGLDHDLAYRALSAGDIDLMDLYSTDAEIAYYGLRVLRDDRRHFTDYDALFLYREELARTHPGVVAALERLAGRFDETRMRRLNAAAKIDGLSEARVAAGFLERQLGIGVEVRQHGLSERLWRRTREHLFLVGVALAAGLLVAVPLGIAAYKLPRLSPWILGVVGIIQTIPSLALLVFMIPLLGIAAPPAIAALFLYSLLPMVRNTHAGLSGLPRSLHESAEALGLSGRGRLFAIELPLASRSILAGIKTSAVITIGFATLGALIGAGGYGQPILTGIRLNDHALILEGAVPAAGLAIAAQLLFDLAERVAIPRGLRLHKEE